MDAGKRHGRTAIGDACMCEINDVLEGVVRIERSTAELAAAYDRLNMACRAAAESCPQQNLFVGMEDALR